MEPNENQPNETPTRPDYIPEKFWDQEAGAVRVEELAKSYAHLESSRNKPEGSDPEDPKPVTIPRKEETQGGDFVLTPDNVMTPEAMAAYSKEYAQNGKLSEETYRILAEGGVSREVVDQVIEDRVANGNNTIAKHERGIFEEVGGKSNFDEIIRWAGETLSDSEIASTEAILNNIKDPVAARNMAKGLQARYLMEATRHPERHLRPTTDSVQDRGGIKAFKDMEEVAKAMSSPDYQPGTDYYNQVIQRVAMMKK